MPDIVALVREAQKGDLSAFAALYDHYFERVYRYVMARVGNSHEAEELTQDVFLKVMQALPSFRFRGPPFAAWLFRVAHNVVVDRVRRRKAAGEAVPLEDAGDIPHGGSVEASALHALDVREMHRALERVTDLQRQVVMLRFIAGLSLAETAAAMRRNENAVKALQHSALNALRRILAPNPGEVKVEE